MKIHFLLFLFSIAFMTAAQAQDPVYDLINEGITLHDKGQYKEAILKYKAAIQKDKKAALAYYEMALSYYILKDYDNAIKITSKVFKYSDDPQITLSAYLVKGAATDDKGDPKRAVKVYKKGVAEFPKEYLLHYNLGLSLYNTKDFEGASKAIENAISLNPLHTSSHYLLATIATQQGFRIQSIMAYGQFLFLENLEHPVNITGRSKKGFELLSQQALGNVTRTGEQSINVNLFMNKADEFSSLNTLMSLMSAQDRIAADSANLSENQRLEQFFNTFGKMIKESNYDKNSFWGKNYASFFENLSTQKMMEAYTHILFLSKSENIDVDWINKNMEAVEAVENLFYEQYQLSK